MEIRNLAFGYDSKSLFHNLNLNLSPASFTLIKGPSGCGKSTLLKLIAGFFKPQKGVIDLQDPELKIGYLHQDCHLIEHWTVKENLMLVSSDSGLTLEFMERFYLKDVLNSLVVHLSGGEKQRISLIRILLQNPDLVLLDEPTAHLDDKNTEEIMKFIKDFFGKKTVIVVSHDSRLDKQAAQIINWKSLVQNGH